MDVQSAALVHSVRHPAGVQLYKPQSIVDCCVQAPPELHVGAGVKRLPAHTAEPHGVPEFGAVAGQSTDVPVHLSSRSQAALLDLQTVFAERNESTGQAGEFPEHTSS